MRGRGGWLGSRGGSVSGSRSGSSWFLVGKAKISHIDDDDDVVVVVIAVELGVEKECVYIKSTNKNEK